MRQEDNQNFKPVVWFCLTRHGTSPVNSKRVWKVTEMAVSSWNGTWED